MRKNQGIAVIGLGDLGTALVHLLGNKYQGQRMINVVTGDRKKIDSVTETGKNAYSKKVRDIVLPVDNLTFFTSQDLGEAVAASSILILTVPSAAVPETIDKILASIKAGDRKTIVLTSKGSDVKSGRTPFEYAEQAFWQYPNINIVLASVVGFAHSLASHEVTKVLVSAKKDKDRALNLVRQMLSTRYLVPEVSHDPRGACLAGLLKNAGAVLIGMCEGMERYRYQDGEVVRIGHNSRYAFVDEYYREMREIAQTLTIREEIIEGLVGKIDLSLSCDPEGRNWSFGYRLAKGESMEDIISDLGTVEGIGAAKYLAMATKARYVSLLTDILEGGTTIQDALGRILLDTTT